MGEAGEILGYLLHVKVGGGSDYYKAALFSQICVKNLIIVTKCYEQRVVWRCGSHVTRNKRYQSIIIGWVLFSECYITFCNALLSVNVNCGQTVKE